MTNGASCSGGEIQARKEWKLSTTTADTDFLADQMERQELALHPYVRVGDIEIFTGYRPKGSEKSKGPYHYLGYVGTVPECRPPTSPGEMLLEEFLKPLGISQRQLARAIRLPYRQVNDIVNERRRLTPAIALRLTRYIGMSVGFWMNLQLAWDLYHAAQGEAEILSEIEPFPRPDLDDETEFG